MSVDWSCVYPPYGPVRSVTQEPPKSAIRNPELNLTLYARGDHVSALSKLERYSTNARRPVDVACTQVRGLDP